MTCDDLFIAVEMSARRDERAEDEKKKKLVLQCQDVEGKALAILQQERSVQSLKLNVKELDVLLAWYQAPKVSGAKKQTSWYNGRTLWPAKRRLLCLLAGRMMMKRGCMGSRRRVLVLALQIRTMGALIFIGGNVVFGHINAVCLSHVEYHVGQI
jgi:hypothetical protein